MSAWWDPLNAWDRCDDPNVTLTGGPERIYDNDPKPEPPRPPIGFRNTETKPLLWEGDDA